MDGPGKLGGTTTEAEPETGQCLSPIRGRLGEQGGTESFREVGGATSRLGQARGGDSWQWGPWSNARRDGGVGVVSPTSLGVAASRLVGGPSSSSPL